MAVFDDTVKKIMKKDLFNVMLMLLAILSLGSCSDKKDGALTVFYNVSLSKDMSQMADMAITYRLADGNTATTNVVVTVTDNAPTIEVTTVAKVEIVDGKVKITLSTSSEGALSGVPVWGATGFDPSTGDWGWLPDPIGYANIDADGNTTLDLTITSESLIISVGKPSYLD